MIVHIELQVSGTWAKIQKVIKNSFNRSNKLTINRLIKH